ncbi:hypothetical protein PTKIN_Ptkin11bG0017700 [Pterospermum kingtungense]
MRSGYIPVSVPAGNVAKKGRGASQSRVFRSAKGWVHAIPVLILLCFFILWWLSSCPENVEIKDEKIVAIHHLDAPLPVTSSQIDVAILASATSPTASAPESLTWNGTEAHLVSKID